MKVISFNSYKGGACRTTTCYNTLPFLAKALGATSDEPIIVYDIDLDSMGLTSIFHAKKRTGKEKLVYSAKHLFVDDENGINQKASEGLDSIKANQEYFGHYEKVGEQLGLEDDGSVLFLGADKNASTVSDDDYLKFAESSPAQTLIKKMKNMLLRPKAIIFDCASGVQMTTLVALQLSDYSVMCMRPTFQFRVGTADYLLRKIPFEINKRRSRQKREIILVPTAVAQMNIPEDDPNRDNALTKLSKLRKEAFDLINADIIEEYKNERKDGGLGYDLNTDMIEDRDEPVVGIPEIERFKWEEGLLYKMDCITEQEKILKRRYEKLAGLLAR